MSESLSGGPVMVRVLRRENLWREEEKAREGLKFGVGIELASKKLGVLEDGPLMYDGKHMGCSREQESTARA